MAKQNYMYSKAHDGKIPVETVKSWSHEVKRKPRVKTAEDPVSEPESVSMLQRLIPGLVLGAAGAGYGALQSPGGSRIRGATIGGVAGAGAGLGLEAGRTFIDSPHGKLMGNGGNTASLFGGAALGGLGGLNAGRELAEYLQLGDRKDDTEDDLSELDARQARSWLPGGLSDLLSTDRHKKAAQFVSDLTKQANTLPYALGGAALGGLAGAYMTGDDEDGRPASMGRRLRNAAIGAGVGGLGGAGLSMFGGSALPSPAASNGVDTGDKLDTKPRAGLATPPALMGPPDLTPSALHPDNNKVPSLSDTPGEQAAHTAKSWNAVTTPPANDQDRLNRAFQHAQQQQAFNAKSRQAELAGNAKSQALRQGKYEQSKAQYDQNRKMLKFVKNPEGNWLGRSAGVGVTLPANDPLNHAVDPDKRSTIGRWLGFGQPDPNARGYGVDGWTRWWNND